MNHVQRVSRSFRWLVMAGLLVALSGCAFDRDYRAAEKVTPTADAPLAGAWKGEWDSKKNWGHGKLHLIMEPVKEDWYRARWKAKAGPFSTKYQMLVNAIPQEDGTYAFTCEKDLEWNRGGIYQYDGRATPDRIDMTYRSDHDHGTFTLMRDGRARSSAASAVESRDGEAGESGGRRVFRFGKKRGS